MSKMNEETKITEYNNNEEREQKLERQKKRKHKVKEHFCQ